MPYGLTIPTTRPRLWLNAERLTAAITWAASNPFTPAGENYVDYAFSWLTQGNTSHRDTAKNWLLNYTTITIPISGGDRDQGRWFGEKVCIVYDWLWNDFTAAERATLLARWNTNFEAFRAEGPSQFDDLYMNNYYWGLHIRNPAMWGIATFEESPSEANVFLDWVFNPTTGTWTETAAYLRGGADGGCGYEGIQYGRYPALYGMELFETAKLLGRNLWGEVDWFKYQQPYFWIYNTTPANTYYQGGGTPARELLPYGDDDTFHVARGTASEPEVGMSVHATLQQHPPGAGIARRIKKWLDDTANTASAYVRAFTPAVTAAADYSDIALDYMAPGPKYLIARASWTDPNATVVRINVGPHQQGVQHFQGDYGDILIWKKGCWLSRETTAYDDNLDGYNAGEIVVGHVTAMHNCVLVHPATPGLPDGQNGITNSGGMVVVGPPNGSPVLRRLESKPNHLYCNIDLSAAYRNDISVPSQPTRGNTAAVHVERDILFIRALGTVVVLDRVESDAAAREKTVLWHSELDPSGNLDDANNVRFVIQDQTLRVTTVLPTTPTRSIRNERANGGSDSTRGQWCLQIGQSGSTQQEFLHVLQARDTAVGNLTITYEGGSTQHVLKLSHTTLGYARVEFGKGMVSSGGGCLYSPTALPETVVAFRPDAQRVTVGIDGPVWEVLQNTRVVTKRGAAWRGGGYTRTR